MKILIVVVYYPPNTTSAAQMMRDLAREFTRQGHSVTVVTPSDSVKEATRVIQEDGVLVARVRTGNMKSAGRVLRLWRESRLSANIWSNARKFFRENPSDLIVFYSPTIFFGDLVKRLRNLWNCPSYLVHRDLFPQWAVEAGILREGSMLHRYLRRKELIQYAAADVIGVEAPGNLDYFKRTLNGQSDKSEVLYNWITAPRQPATNSEWRRTLELEGKIVFFYGGNIGAAQDMDNILRLASSLQEQDRIFFLLVGSGSEVRRLNAEITRMDLKNMKILPPLPESEYMRCLSEFDVGLVSLDRHLKSNNFTGKVLGYVGCGKPILASVNPGNDLIAFINDSDAGIACANGEDGRLRDAALLLAAHPEIRRRMGENARALSATVFSVESVANQILSHFVEDVECARTAS